MLIVYFSLFTPRTKSFTLASLDILYIYSICIIYPPVVCGKDCEETVLSNRILRDNVQHPRYEPLRVQILRERPAWRTSVRPKKL